MPLAIRHAHDPAPPLRPLPGFRARIESDALALARLMNRPADELAARLAGGHRAWIGSLHGTHAAFGWVATRRARIGELDLEFPIPEGDRYLWNFVTLPEHRGRGVYPHLLEAIIRAESAAAQRFWIIWAPENRASGSGIGKAGFTPVAELSFDRHGAPAASGPDAEAAARLLAVARTDGALAPCWRCARAGRAWVTFCAPGQCRCDYQDPAAGCH